MYSRNSNMYKTVSIIIPVFNEKEYIKKIVKRVFSANTLGLNKEVIIVDDASTDGTKEIIKKIIKNNGDKKKFIKAIYKKSNTGKGGALKTGFKYVHGDIIIVQDADLEYDPQDYKRLLKPFLIQNSTVVYGSRTLGINVFGNKYSNIFFYTGGRLLTQILNVLYGIKLTDQPTGYKLFSKKILPLIMKKSRQDDFTFEVEMTAFISKQKIPITEVAISYIPRTKKQGKKIRFSDFIKSVFVAIQSKK